MTEYSFEGVHLLPDYEYPYNQRTYAAEGIEMEDIISVKVCNLCGTEIGDVSIYFNVLETFNDPDTGLPQIIWQLKGATFDAGYQLVYLKIRTGANVFVYSSPFLLTNKNSEYTSYWGYKNKKTDEYLYIGLITYFRQNKSQQEISNYTAVSTGETFTATSRLTKYERWNTGVIDINIIEEYKTLFLCRYLYSLPTNFDGLPVRTNLFEAFDTPDLEADENFAEQEILLLRNYSQTLDPNEIPIVPPPPPVDVPFINLIKVESKDLKNVLYTFTYGFFTPTSLTYQYSLDQVNWFDSTGAIISPHQVGVGNHQVLNYYYRIYHFNTGTQSNIVQLAQPAITIDNITSPQTSFIQVGNNYNIFYTVTGFTPASDFAFEGSVNGSDWVGLYYSLGFQNPKTVQTPSSAEEFKFFRIKYSPSGLYSNVFNFQF